MLALDGVGNDGSRSIIGAAYQLCADLEIVGNITHIRRNTLFKSQDLADNLPRVDGAMIAVATTRTVHNPGSNFLPQPRGPV